MKVHIVDYGAGNLHSIYKRVKDFAVAVSVGDDYSGIEQADKIILPGVGHFGNAVRNIRALGLWENLNERVLVKKKPILGICLGMQLMADSSEEDTSEHGFGWISGNVAKFTITDKIRYKVPHIGWSGVTGGKQSVLTNGIADGAEFYFTHSYHYQPVYEEDILGITQYEYPFISAIERENIFGVQYHPEKSHATGAKLIENFLKM